MELKNYTKEQQKSLVLYWNFYYSKGMRTVEELDEFEQLVDRRLDDLLKLMALEVFTDFASHFESWPKKDSLCNFIYLISKANKEKTNTNATVDGFLDLASKYFSEVGFKVTPEETIETTLKEYERCWNEEQKDTQEAPSRK